MNDVLNLEWSPDVKHVKAHRAKKEKSAVKKKTTNHCGRDDQAKESAPYNKCENSKSSNELEISR